MKLTTIFIIAVIFALGFCALGKYLLAQGI